jgi:hypothetical protein
MENGKAPHVPRPFAPAFHEASWSAVAERSGDTAFAPQVPLRDASRGIARVSRALFGVSPKSSVPVSGFRSHRPTNSLTPELLT